MEEDKNLESEFRKYVEIARNMPPQSADNMLIAYAYYKQATIGDNENERPQESSNVVKTFKHDTWQRLRGMPPEEAKKKYINTIKRLLEEG